MNPKIKQTYPPMAVYETCLDPDSNKQTEKKKKDEISEHFLDI